MFRAKPDPKESEDILKKKALLFFHNHLLEKNFKLSACYFSPGMLGYQMRWNGDEASIEISSEKDYPELRVFVGPKDSFDWPAIRQTCDLADTNSIHAQCHEIIARWDDFDKRILKSGIAP